MNARLPDLEPVQTRLNWDHSFHRLGPCFFTPLAPQPLPDPYWVGQSPAVAQLLGLHGDWLHSDGLLQALSGNRPLSGSRPLASVYSGHQFGHWAGQLGDGRAILLGEANGLELQIKGSGLTPYSRRGDGRAVLRSSIREFLCSEAMHALGIPTTRALCVIGSDEEVWRETLETAAVVTRVAPSFIRFGHFEHFAARRQTHELRQLADYVIDRFYPDCRTELEFGANPYAALLHRVTKRSADMVAHWQAVGFCHGVMNTDNMSILGLTIDYGPFQFMDAYDPSHICNHSDTQGRYAFDAQPSVVRWNLFALAQALLSLIEDPTLARAALYAFEPTFLAALQQRLCAKLGWTDEIDSGASLLTETDTAPLRSGVIDSLLRLLAQGRVDYSIFWRRLSVAVANDDFAPVRDLFIDQAAIERWLISFRELSAHIDKALQADLMLNSNPKFVLRNYLAESAIAAAKNKDFSMVGTLLRVLQAPFDEHPDCEAYAAFPPDWAQRIEISCSS